MRRSKLEQQILQTIAAHRMFKAGDRVAVAVSGGADSVALLRLLENLAHHLGITLLLVHFNHLLRGADSDADEAFVAALAEKSGLEFISSRADVAAEARRHKWNLEDAARRLRYQFFASLVENGRATRVAVAHTADDQAETVLARIIRGAGLTGLAGIFPVLGHVVRPLIEVRRSELRRFLEKRGETWREDSTNLDTRRLRARVRSQLLPALERDFSSSIVQRLNELARLSREEDQFWSALVEDRFRALTTLSPAGLSIPIADLLAPIQLSQKPFSSANLDAVEFPLALTQRVIRRILEHLRGERQGITARHVRDVIHLASASSSGSRIHLPGVAVERNFDRLLFQRSPAPSRARPRNESAKSAFEYQVELPARGSTAVAVPELGRRFRLKMIDWPLAQRDTNTSALQALDADRLRGPLVLRSWRPGDAYRPCGRSRVHKLKRLFLAGRIAVRERACWPVLTSAGKLVWARGMPPAEEFVARAGTRTGLVIAEEGL